MFKLIYIIQQRPKHLILNFLLFILGLNIILAPITIMSGATYTNFAFDYNSDIEYFEKMEVTLKIFSDDKYATILKNDDVKVTISDSDNKTITIYSKDEFEIIDSDDNSTKSIKQKILFKNLDVYAFNINYKVDKEDIKIKINNNEYEIKDIKTNELTYKKLEKYDLQPVFITTAIVHIILNLIAVTIYFYVKIKKTYTIRELL